MKIKYYPLRKFEYHKWFAWYPVRAYGYKQEPDAESTDMYWVWLEYVERKKVANIEFSFYFKRILI